MNVDLTQQNIVELAFDALNASSEEKIVADAVRVVNASKNQIRLLRGLDLVFHQLTELNLAHNRLGVQSQKRQQLTLRSTAGLCDGIPPWVKALPGTLRVLDVSYNEILSFLYCTCEDSRSRCAGPQEILSRQLRHASPNSLTLFFSSSRFPGLTRLVLSHNRFASTVELSRLAEENWYNLCEQSTPKDAAALCVESTLCELDLSVNSGISCVNDFLFGSPFKQLSTLNVEGCDVTDLFGLSAVPHYAPSLVHLILRMNPVANSIVSATPATQKELLETVLQPLVVQLAPVQSEKHITALVQEVSQKHLDTFQTCLFPTPVTQSDDAVGSSLGDCLYAALIHLVAPNVTKLDSLSTKACLESLLDAFRHTAKKSMPHSKMSSKILQSIRDPSDSAVVDLCMVAAQWDPLGKCRWIQTCSDDEWRAFPHKFNTLAHPISTPNNACSLPSASDLHEPLVDNGEVFEDTKLTVSGERQCSELLARARSLEQDIANSRKTQQKTEASIQLLQEQLTTNRKEIKERRKAIVLLETREKRLTENISGLKQRLQKRRLEVLYGKKSMAFKAKRIESEHDRERGEAARSSRSPTAERPVSYAGQQKEVRSEVFRKAAAREKIESFKKQHPFSFSPTRFRSESSEREKVNEVKEEVSTAPFGTDLSHMEQDYLSLYARPLPSSTDPSPQKTQLGTIMANLSRTGMREPASSWDVDKVDPVTSSITALFDAAAAIRKKQLLLREAQEVHTSRLATEAAPQTEGKPSDSQASLPKATNRVLFP